MSEFTQAHALLVGVGTYQNMPYANVPITTADAKALNAVLADSAYCGYPTNQINQISDQTATRDGFLAALDNLAKSTTPDSTVFLFYAGHGKCGTDGAYYLTTHDSKLENNRVAAGTGVSEGELIAKLREIPAKRLLLIFNACHSGEINPSLDLDGPVPLESEQPPEKALDAILSTGEGRIIMTACRPNQKSWIGKGTLTIFTQALIEGLKGGSYVGNNNGYISAFSLYEHLYATVKENAEKAGRKQDPMLTVLRGVGPFPVSLYKGASSLGLFDTESPLPKDAATREVDPLRSQRLLNTYIIATAGERGVAAGGNISGGTIITGDGNRIDNSSSVFNQSEQIVYDSQTNIDSNVNTGGGAYIGGNVTAGGDFVGRDKVVGDKISVGNISGGSGIAIGRNASASVNEGVGSVSRSELSILFESIYQAIENSSQPPPIQSVIKQQVQNIETELNKGTQIDIQPISDAFTVIKTMAPDISLTLGAMVASQASLPQEVKEIAATVSR